MAYRQMPTDARGGLCEEAAVCRGASTRHLKCRCTAMDGYGPPAAGLRADQVHASPGARAVPRPGVRRAPPLQRCDDCDDSCRQGLVGTGWVRLSLPCLALRDGWVVTYRLSRVFRSSAHGFPLSYVAASSIIEISASITLLAHRFRSGVARRADPFDSFSPLPPPPKTRPTSSLFPSLALDDITPHSTPTRRRRRAAAAMELVARADGDVPFGWVREDGFVVPWWHSRVGSRTRRPPSTLWCAPPR